MMARLRQAVWGAAQKSAKAALLAVPTTSLLHTCLHLASPQAYPPNPPLGVALAATLPMWRYLMLVHVSMLAMHVAATQERDLPYVRGESRLAPVCRALRGRQQPPFKTAAFLAAKRLAMSGPTRRQRVLHDASGENWRELVGPCLRVVRAASRSIADTFQPSADVYWEQQSPSFPVWKSAAANAEASWKLKAKQTRLACSVHVLSTLLRAVKGEDKFQVSHFCQPTFGELLAELLLLYRALRRYLTLMVGQPHQHFILYQLSAPSSQAHYLPARALHEQLLASFYYLARMYGDTLLFAVSKCPERVWVEARYGDKAAALKQVQAVLGEVEAADGSVFRSNLY